MSLSVPLEPPSKEILHISSHYLEILVKYYRKRGSASYIVREELLVREIERERLIPKTIGNRKRDCA